MKKYRLKFARGFMDGVGITLIFFTGILAPVALILLIDLVEIHQIESSQVERPTPSASSTDGGEPLPAGPSAAG